MTEDDLLKKVLRVFIGVEIPKVIDVLRHAYVSMARTNGHSKEDVVRGVEELLAREAAPGRWAN